MKYVNPKLHYFFQQVHRASNRPSFEKQKTNRHQRGTSTIFREPFLQNNLARNVLPTLTPLDQSPHHTFSPIKLSQLAPLTQNRSTTKPYTVAKLAISQQMQRDAPIQSRSWHLFNELAHALPVCNGARCVVCYQVASCFVKLGTLTDSN